MKGKRMKEKEGNWVMRKVGNGAGIRIWEIERSKQKK